MKKLLTSLIIGMLFMFPMSVKAEYERYVGLVIGVPFACNAQAPFDVLAPTFQIKDAEKRDTLGNQLTQKFMIEQKCMFAQGGMVPVKLETYIYEFMDWENDVIQLWQVKDRYENTLFVLAWKELLNRALLRRSKYQEI